LLTESEVDTDLYKKFVSDSDCYFGSASNRSGVISTLERFSEYKMGGCAGIIDADSDYVLGHRAPRPEVFLTDKTDKETTIIDSPAFDDFCSTAGARLPASQLRGLLYDAAFPLGAIRRIAARNGIALDFKEIAMANLIEAGPKCNTSGCCWAVVRANPHLGLSADTLTEFLTDPAVTGIPKPYVVRGHDLVAILEAQSGSLFGRQLSRREIECELAKSYTSKYFHTTVTYSGLRAWEKSVIPKYRVFPDA
jgi:hypothetical protein